MMQTRNIEIMVGAFLLAGILALLVLAFQVSGLTNIVGTHGYQVSAAFDNVGDLRVRAPVSVGGVRIGEVTGIQLDHKTFKAIVSMQINPQQNSIPNDSAASILTQGLLGSNYISLTPGFSDTNLKNGDKILTTHSAIILENLIGQLMYKFSNNDKNDKSDNADDKVVK
jgi:phospholipid/cholesterol/gamma-HCH transport system substrate-binding protein